MNAEALTHAAKACREMSEAEMQVADRLDVFLHAVPDAGAGMLRDAREARARAIGLKVASAFLARCARFPGLLTLLTALEAGRDVLVLPDAQPVVVRDDQDAPARPTLPARLRALLGRLSLARAA